MKKIIIAVIVMLGAVQLHAQGCTAVVYLSTYETTSPVLHQASVTVVAASGYGVSPGYDATLRAGELVEIKDGTYIKPGSLFLAKIGACTKVKSQNNAIDGESVFTAYPNPVGSILTLSAGDTGISKVTVTAIDGRAIATQDTKNETTVQFNFENYPSGVYLITVNTTNGNTFQEKIVKN